MAVGKHEKLAWDPSQQGALKRQPIPRRFGNLRLTIRADSSREGLRIASTELLHAATCLRPLSGAERLECRCKKSHGRDPHKLDLADGRYMSGVYMSGASKRFRKFTLTGGDHRARMLKAGGVSFCKLVTHAGQAAKDSSAEDVRRLLQIAEGGAVFSWSATCCP